MHPSVKTQINCELVCDCLVVTKFCHCPQAFWPDRGAASLPFDRVMSSNGSFSSDCICFTLLVSLA